MNSFDFQRIELVLKHFNIKSVRALSKEIGLKSPQIFYDIKAGKCGISKELANKMQDKFLQINKLWLLTGEGEMLKPSSQPEPPAVSVAVSDDVARLLGIIESQQRVIESQAQAIKILSEK